MISKIIDVSLSIYPGMITYPGNPEVNIKKIKTKTSWISQIELGTHTGTHIDAPAHVFKSGKGIDRLDLECFIGPCRVIEIKKKLSVSVDDLKDKKIKKGERILFKTINSDRGYKKFHDDYTFVDADAAIFLADKGIKLLGVDYLSVKKKGEADNRSHTAILSKNIPIIEGLNLSNVKPGRYFLAALPLKIKGGDGAPARVLLLS